MDNYKPAYNAGTEPDGTDTDANGSGGVGSLGLNFLGGSGASADGIGDRDAGGNEFDPERHVDRTKFNADGTFRRKRGRKSGGNSAPGTRNKNAGIQASVDTLTRVLLITHIGIAATTKTPEIVLEEQEAESLAQATARLLQEFDIRPDPKIEAVIGLVWTAGAIYGPRAYMIRQRWKAEKEAK